MRILTGIQPSGVLHIGNYFGAIKQWLELQAQNHELYVMIADLHAITVPFEAEALVERTRQVAIDLLALGLDPQKTTLFVQSHLSEHPFLAWLLHSVAPYGQLQRMTQFKEKSQKHSGNVTAGLFSYPILQAADILLYDAELVPVGEDQKQHVEFTRDLAQKFNARFGEVFKLPEAVILKESARIMSLSEPDKKMSKSDEPASYITLADELEIIKAKLGRAVTDSKSALEEGRQSKGVDNLLSLYMLATSKKKEDIIKAFAGKGYAEFKKALAEELAKLFTNYRSKRRNLQKDQNQVDAVLKKGADKARLKAKEKLVQVKKAMGFFLQTENEK